MIKPARPHPEHNRTSDTILQTAGTGRRKPIQGFPEPVPAVFSSLRPLVSPYLAVLMPPVQRRSETKKEEPSPHAACPHNHPVTVSDVVHVERTAQGTRIPDARREHDGRNHHHRRLLAPRPADGIEHVRRRGTRRPAYGRNPPYPHGHGYQPARRHRPRGLAGKPPRPTRTVASPASTTRKDIQWRTRT